jgi:hypothetical protein
MMLAPAHRSVTVSGLMISVAAADSSGLRGERVYGSGAGDGARWVI